MVCRTERRMVLLLQRAGVARRRTSGSSLESLYELHAAAALRFAFALTGETSSAQDLTHEAFVRVFGRFGELRGPESFERYLKATILNLARNQWKRRKLETRWLEQHKRELRDPQPPLDRATRLDLWQQLQALPLRERAAIFLKYYEDLSDTQIADALGCSVSAVKSLLWRALNRLRDGVGGIREP